MTSHPLLSFYLALSHHFLHHLLLRQNILNTSGDLYLSFLRRMKFLAPSAQNLADFQYYRPCCWKWGCVQLCAREPSRCLLDCWFPTACYDERNQRDSLLQIARCLHFLYGKFSINRPWCRAIRSHLLQCHPQCTLHQTQKPLTSYQLAKRFLSL